MHRRFVSSELFGQQTGSDEVPSAVVPGHPQDTTEEPDKLPQPGWADLTLHADC